MNNVGRDKNEVEDNSSTQNSMDTTKEDYKCVFVSAQNNPR